ncbi:MAG: hypothetical protein AAFQ94_17070 [Bacteroidota bacterium]
MKYLICTLFFAVFIMGSCQPPELTEIEIDQADFYLEIVESKKCNKSDGGGSAIKQQYSCSSLTSFLTNLLSNELSQNYKASTGLDFKERIFKFQEHGKRNPYRFDINFQFKKEANLPYAKVIKLLENYYHFKVSYTPRTYTFYQITIVDSIKFENILSQKYPADQPFLIKLNELESALSNRYPKSIKVTGIDANFKKLPLELPSDFESLDATLKAVGLTIQEKSIQIPYPSIEYL